MLQKISPDDLVPMDRYEADYPLRVELAYARGGNLLFGERIYRKEARLWLHKDLAAIVLKAAEELWAAQRWRLVLYDGLRTVDAQDAMLHTQHVKDNRHWLEEPRLLSPPGAGAHPRGMAIDLAPETAEGTLIDMGTPFDFLAENPHTDHNPAHRAYAGHTLEIMENRKLLERAMIDAAQVAGHALLPLPQEWWDFRFPPTVYEAYAPLEDADLSPDMRLLSRSHNHS